MVWTYTEFENRFPFHQMVFVEGGSFMMGSDAPEAYDDEKPVHHVEVPSFFIGKFLVTQSLWEVVMSENPSEFKGENRPVETVSWIECHDFLERLNKKTNHRFRLPSEAEWEFAARGGTQSEGYKYAGSDWLPDVGWFEENSGSETREVGLISPNELGLYDMSGNLWEWCEDDWQDNHNNARQDGSARILSPKRGDYRVLRGGGWGHTARLCRVSCRDYGGPGDRSNGIGLRLACSPR